VGSQGNVPGGFEHTQVTNYILSASLTNTNLMSAVQLDLKDLFGNPINFGDNGIWGDAQKPFGHFVYTGTGGIGKNQLYFEENTTYEISFKAYATDEIKNTINPNIRVPRLDVYLNDYRYDEGHYIRQGDITTPSDQVDKHRYDLDIPFVNTLDPAQDDGYITDFSRRYGKHILAVEGTVDTAVFNISGIFKTTKNLRLAPAFVVRRGRWSIGDISIKSVKETGFTPDSTRIRLKVPTEYRNIPLSFKFQYVDYQGTPADLQTVFSSVTFTG